MKLQIKNGSFLCGHFFYYSNKFVKNIYQNSGENEIMKILHKLLNPPKIMIFLDRIRCLITFLMLYQGENILLVTEFNYRQIIYTLHIFNEYCKQ